MLSRRLFAAVLGLACLVVTVNPGFAANREAAEKFMKGLTDEAVSMASRQMTVAEKQARFRELLHTRFDLQEIGRFILGRYWRIATPEQREQFLSLFEDLTVITWSRRFDEYGGETIDVTSFGNEGEALLIETRVNRPKGPAVPVTWRVRESEAGFRVVDIIVEGVSMAITHRSEYTSAIQSTGGVDGLLGAMRNKIDMLRGDAAKG